jgi:hypothetical protein
MGSKGTCRKGKDITHKKEHKVIIYKLSESNFLKDVQSGQC